ELVSRLPASSKLSPRLPRKACSLSLSNRVPLRDEHRSNFAARLRHHIRFCRFFNLLPHDRGSLGSPRPTEPTTGNSHARSKTFSCRGLITPGRNSLKGGRELSGKNLRYPASA